MDKLPPILLVGRICNSNNKLNVSKLETEAVVHQLFRLVALPLVIIISVQLQQLQQKVREK